MSPALGGARNLGLRDQRAAVEWLHANLAAFGGDPAKMTLFGESAGGASVGSYAYAYPKNPLVRGAILMSGTAAIIGDPGPGEFARVAAAVGCGAADLACMRRVSAARLKSAVSNATLNDYASPNGGQPGIDNATVFSPAETLRRGLAGEFAKIVSGAGAVRARDGC